MAFLLDTNVVSEPSKPRPSPAVLRWLQETDPSSVHLSVLTLGELRKGAAKVRPADTQRADDLERWLSRLVVEFASRLLDVDAAVADQWGRVAAATTSTPIDAVDGLIAATALVHGLTVVTRNVRHFEPTGVPTFDPFEAG